MPLLTLAGSRGDAVARFLWRWGLHLLLLFDGVMSAGLWLGVTALRFSIDRPINPFWHYQVSLFFVVIWWWVANALCDLYSRPLELAPLKQGKDLVRASALFSMGLLSFGYLAKGSLDPGRSIVLPVCALNFVALFLSRSLVRWIEIQLRKRGYGRVRTVLVGSGPLAQESWRRLVGATVREHQVVGVLRVGEEPETPPGVIPKDVLGDIGQLPKILEVGGIDQVVFASEGLSQAEILNLISRCPSNHDVHFRFVCHDLSTVLVNRSVGVEEIDGVLVANLGPGSPHPGYLVLKRGLDITVAALLAPLAFLVCAVLAPIIRYKSGASPFFWQRRAGLDGKEFWMVKLRTMRPDADEYAEAPNGPGDPRVLGRLGAWLRRTSLDEIPQIYNVLRGEMTLVGPRPEMPTLVARYEPWQLSRLRVPPGVTGLWQILGRKNLPLHANLEYDFYYIQNRSFLLDLVILVRTIPVVLFGKGAY
ncbi:MAG: sugar transferase [Candidatus Omnitrophica bacterium]|nr:UDP-glucose:undecaprenyl-phosphate glucose-1-phosphate transferase [bacterium]NUN95436.1 sugar transferase [Candidatus Omnitrophota bacterium]